MGTPVTPHTPLTHVLVTGTAESHSSISKVGPCALSLCCHPSGRVLVSHHVWQGGLFVRCKHRPERIASRANSDGVNPRLSIVLLSPSQS